MCTTVKGISDRSFGDGMRDLLALPQPDVILDEIRTLAVE